MKKALLGLAICCLLTIITVGCNQTGLPVGTGTGITPSAINTALKNYHFVRSFNNHLSGPWGLALSGDNVIVADYSDNNAVMFKKDGTYIKTFGSFSEPYGVRVHDNKIYIADYDDAYVQEFDINGNYLSYIGYIQNWGWTYPTDVAFDTGGNMYIADDFSYVVKLDVNQNYVTYYSNGLSEPVGLAFDNSGNLLISDYDYDAVATYSPAGQFMGRVSSYTQPPSFGNQTFYEPYFLAFFAGQTYVSDYYNDGIFRGNSQNQLTASIGSTGPNSVSGPGQIDIDSATGEVYVAEYDNGQVSVWAPDTRNDIH